MAVLKDLARGRYFNWAGWGDKTAWREILDFGSNGPHTVLILYYSQVQGKNLVREFALTDLTIRDKPGRKLSGFGSFTKRIDTEYPVGV